MSHPIVLYDGVCGLCNGFVQFVLKRDREGKFRFASLQSSLAQGLLGKHGVNAGDLDTVYVVLNGGIGSPEEQLDSGEERLLARADAVLFVGRQLGGIWRFAAGVSGLLPRVLQDWGYRVVAGNRYRWFGKYDACPLPSAETRSRFLDL